MPHANPDERRAYDVERVRRLDQQQPGWRSPINRRWNAANRAKKAAHKAIERALASGQLNRQPCERCGISYRVHAHHDDYSRPHDVMWLCPAHHKERHRELRRTGVPAA